MLGKKSSLKLLLNKLKDSKVYTMQSNSLNPLQRMPKKSLTKTKISMRKREISKLGKNDNVCALKFRSFENKKS